MKIAYLLGSLNRGGTETLLLDVFRNAAANQLDAIAIYRKSGVLEADFISSTVQLYKLPFQKNVFNYFFRLRRLLINHGINQVHAQQPLDALLAWVATLGLDMKIVLTLHGYDFQESSLGKMILSFILKRTDTNIYVSNTQREYYKKKYRLDKKKQRVVHNGISFEKFDGALDSTWGATLSRTPSSNNLRTELVLSSEMLFLGTVGNFNNVRDQLSICRFLKLLKKEDVSFYFVFVGKKVDNSADLYDDCVNYCRQNNLLENVSFLGSRDDVPDILSQLDAFVYATDHDTFGIGVVEAMAVGIPVFVNDWQVMSEITDSGKYATLYKTKDEQDLLRQFLLFLQDRTDFLTKAANASSFVRHKYSIEKHIEKLKKIYNN
ncbi:MAG: glycosyltransferase family 4 protein [Paludibacter sp.]|nr:glycosyltransferase family 4 protein [Paludibacter sp.]